MKYKIVLPILCLCLACVEKKRTEKVSEKPFQQVSLMTLDPGHFHAALVHKTMYAQVDSTIYVYAPKGPEVADFLDKIEQYNERSESPTAWKVEKYLGEDYLQKMISEKPGNVMIVAGKNSKKIDYILAAVKAGLNVYADKPLVINAEGFDKLKHAFRIAKDKNVLIYDIMTERFESTTALQKLFSTLPEVFGELTNGTAEEPAISKESVHHFFKYVSGSPLIRPAWFFDVNEEGEGIVDVTTHLVDLIQWEAFPDQILDSTDIDMISAKKWPTVLSLEEFEKVTGLSSFPKYLDKDMENGKLKVYSNGEMVYKIKEKYAKVSVVWNFEAPEGTGDTHYSIMRGTKSNLIIKQGKNENYKPILYLESKGGNEFETELKKALETDIAQKFPGTTAEKLSDTLWKISVPEKFKVGHEAHFGQVTENYLKYLGEGKLPVWEVPNMITKYYTTTQAQKMAVKEN